MNTNKKDKALAKSGSMPRFIEDEKEMNQQIYSQWAVVGDDEYSATSKTKKKLDSGLYSFKFTQRGLVFSKIKIATDELLTFNESIHFKILSEIEKFWSLKQKFFDYKFLHRRGYLFWGPHGSGKSMIVKQIIDGIIKNNGVAFLCNRHPFDASEAIREFRQIEPDRNIVCIFEDIDELIEHYDEADLLSFLDGENQIDSALCIATTNYPEKLDKRIIARPRRFDRIIKIDLPSKDMRKQYLQYKMKISENEIDEWVNKTEGFSFAALADLVISVKCFENDFNESIKVLNNIMKQKLSSEQFTDEKFGF